MVRRVMCPDTACVDHGTPLRHAAALPPLAPLAQPSGLADVPRVRRRRLLQPCSVWQHVVASVEQTVHVAGPRGTVAGTPGGAAAGLQTGERPVGLPRCGEVEPAPPQGCHPCPDAAAWGWTVPSLRGVGAWHATCTLVARDPAHRGIRIRPFDSTLWRLHMKWTTPSYTEMRFGFEVTMYIANR